MHTFSIYNFSDKEITMICDLMKKSAQGYITPIKRSLLTKQVIDYTLGWKLLELREKKLYFPQFSGFKAFYDLPVEALWRLVSPMLREQGSTGYSIVNNKMWEDHLNIYAQRSRHATDADLDAKIEILLKLSKYHYINFQMAGDVWCIYREQEVA